MVAISFGRTLPMQFGMEESASMKKRVISTREGARAIGQRLAAFRKARGLTQIDVAQALDITQSLISKYEAGDLLLHGELIAQFAAVLRASTDEILGVTTKKTAAASPAPIVDRGLARRFAQLQALPRRDRETVARTIDALVAARAGRAA